MLEHVKSAKGPCERMPADCVWFPLHLWHVNVLDLCLSLRGLVMMRSGWSNSFPSACIVSLSDSASTKTT